MQFLDYLDVVDVGFISLEIIRMREPFNGRL